MSATEHSHRAWVLVDPVQDYEESLTILGIYCSDKAARFAARACVQAHSDRDLEAQEWRGDDLLRVWNWDWRDRKWSLCYRNPITPCRRHDHAEVESWQPSVDVIGVGCAGGAKEQGMSEQYRVEYTILKSDDGFETQQEVGFGSSGTWETVDACGHIVMSDLQNGCWETSNSRA